jgi:hypothetical protein
MSRTLRNGTTCTARHTTFVTDSNSHIRNNNYDFCSVQEARQVRANQQSLQQIAGTQVEVERVMSNLNFKPLKSMRSARAASFRFDEASAEDYSEEAQLKRHQQLQESNALTYETVMSAVSVVHVYTVSSNHNRITARYCI